MIIKMYDLLCTCCAPGKSGGHGKTSPVGFWGKAPENFGYLAFSIAQNSAQIVHEWSFVYF